MEEFNHWQEIADAIDSNVNQLVRATAFKIEAGAKRRAPVDTGFLRNSIYTVTEDGGGFAGAFVRAVSRRAKTYSWRATKNQELNFQRSAEAAIRTSRSHAAAHGMLFSEVETPGHNEAIVAVGATYGIFVEFGTSHMPARPYFTPAFEEVRGQFLRALERLANGEGVK